MTDPIQLTAAQADAVDWAVEGLHDYWLDEIEEADPDGEVPRPVVLPTLKGKSLSIAGVHGSVLDDLMYRLKEQGDDVAGDYAPFGANNVAGRNAWKKVSSAMTPTQIAQLEQARGE